MNPMSQVETILSLLGSRTITPGEAQARLAKLADGVAASRSRKSSAQGCVPPRASSSEAALDPRGPARMAVDSGEPDSKKALPPHVPATRKRAADCVAIVGAAGRYPDAENLPRFWQNLKEGKNSIREVPATRWDVNAYFDARPNRSGKIYCKWLGALEDIDCFDPLFFGISPAEAEAMDPQHRIFLLEAYKAFADAGYSPRSLDNLKCGVYLGIMNSEYGVMMHDHMAALGASAAMGKSAAIAAARIAYYLNLKGPAISIDTACSSSLVATHLACQALLNGEVDMALAGGVSLYLTPEAYVAMCSAGMLAPDGQCKTFDNRADGFVPGEGAGAVVLKRLSDAEADRDFIYGVIVASGLNQDGKTNGITAPSVTSQSALTRDLYRRYEINPEDITYAEMHGTGTKLGDPIELEALATVFGEHTTRRQFCSIGSVKSNIGHTSAAAGVASIHKVLLALEHSAIPPTLNFEQPNEHFAFEQSPFRVNTELSRWMRTPGKPRRAAVSAFGFSGTNAHLIIEEYERREGIPVSSPEPSNLKGIGDCLFLLSARSMPQLQALAGLLHERVEKNETLELRNIAYTLQTGRDDMDFRASFVAGSRPQLLQTLAAMACEGAAPGVFQGQVKEGKMVAAMLESDEDATELLRAWMRKGKLQRLGELWVRGLEPDWSGLYGAQKPQRVPLPACSFAKQRFWLPQTSRVMPRATQAAAAGAALLHPLLHRNVSTLARQTYRSVFSGHEFFFADHVIQGARVMPGVAFLELALAAVSDATESPRRNRLSIALKDHVWMRPLRIAEEPVQIQVSLDVPSNGRISYEIHAQESNGGQIVYCQGKAEMTSETRGLRSADLDAIRGRCTINVAAEDCYKAFDRIGVQYGPAFRGLQSVWVEESGFRQALARVTLPAHLQATSSSFVLHPSVLDASLQSVIALSLAAASGLEEDMPEPAVAFALDAFEQLAECPESVWVWVRQRDDARGSNDARKGRNFDIDVCDDRGRICFLLRGFRLATPEGVAFASTSAGQSPGAACARTGSWTLMPVWDLDSSARESRPLTGKLIVVGGDRPLHRALRQRHADTCVLQADSTRTAQQIAEELQRAGPFTYLIWVAPTTESLASTESKGLERSIDTSSLIRSFHMVKAMLELGLGASTLHCAVLTQRAYSGSSRGLVDPIQAAIHGLFGALAKEFPNWNVRTFDQDDWSDVPLNELFPRSLPHRGDSRFLRNGESFVQKFVPCLLPKPAMSRFRNEGVYVIVGGAGVLGEAVSEYLVRTYKARVMWLGRRPLDHGISTKLRRLSSFGPPPEYFSVDATDENSLDAATQEIKRRFGVIHGVIQSTLVFAAQSVAETSEANFRARLAAKMDASHCVARVYEKESLDFLLFFSSTAAFIRNSNQSHYAAGCTFTDGLAQNLRMRWACPVKVLNWGYWDGESLRRLEASDPDAAFKDRMRQIGIGFIEPAEAMEAMEALLAGPVHQMVFLKTTKADAVRAMGLAVDTASGVTVAPQSSRPEGQRLDGILPVLSDEALVLPEHTSSLIADFEGLLARLLFSQLDTLGLGRDTKFSVRRWKDQASLATGFNRWVGESLAALSAAGHLTVEGDTCTVAYRSQPGMADLWSEWEHQAAAWLHDDVLRPRVPLVERTLRVLPDILRGTRKATEVLFPDGSPALVQALYANNPVANFLNEKLAEAVSDFVERQGRHGADGKVRLIEIGAGTGSTSLPVLRKLEPHSDFIEVYRFTDVSKAFLQRAETHLGERYAYLSCSLFNVEQEPAEQGLEVGTYDVVIASNVFHTTRNMRQTLRNAKALLKRSGMLVFIETAGKSLFSHLTFGLLDGWWTYEDEAVRIPGCPAIAPAMWQHLLHEEGFHSVTAPLQQAGKLGQLLVVAQSDGVIRQTDTAVKLSRDRGGSAGATAGSSPSGKTRTVPSNAKPAPDSPAMLLRRIRDVVIEKLAHCLKMEPGNIDPEEPFADYGLDSILGIRLVQDLNRDLGLDLSVTSLFDYASVRKLAEYIQEHDQAALAARFTPVFPDPEEVASSVEEVAEIPERKPGLAARSPWHGTRSVEAFAVEPIAVIGMSGRFPESQNLDELWAHLAQGDELVREISRWKVPNRKQRRAVGGFLSNIDHFDPVFFNLSGSEAACMDPQQRLFLEESYKALEDAGYAGTTADGMRCGVYVGFNGSDYRQLLQGEVPAQAMWGNASSVLSARIAYYLNLTGPAITIDSACSSSLVAVHLASQALWSGETDMALAGGVSIYCTPSFYNAATRADMVSTAGHCYTFDLRADGFVPGEGVGVVVLKRLRDALADGDYVHGILRGSGINQDGATNGITAPSALSQERLERSVYDRFHIDPADIQMVEAHGTGTRLGDPIEFQALSKAFRHYTTKKQFCAIGSIKTNIGHATAAAGVAGLLKVLLSFRNRQIPPSLNYERGNPHINFEESPFFVNTALTEWQANSQGRRCAAISSFGMSGTNAHVVLEQSPQSSHRSPERPFYLIALSARTAEQLGRLVERLVAHCRTHPEIDCGNMSFTLLMGRKHFGYRLAAVVRDRADLLDQLERWLEHRESPDVVSRRGRPAPPALAHSQHDARFMRERSQRKIAAEYRAGLLELAQLFVDGYTLAWQEFLESGLYLRVPLPTYPFAADRHWYAEGLQASNAQSDPIVSVEAALDSGAPLPHSHPLVQRNTSDLLEQRFTSHFSGREAFIADHVVQGYPLFPAVGYLEMARAAVVRSVRRNAATGGLDEQAVRVRNVVWLEPLRIVPERGMDVHIALHPLPSGEIAFEVFTLAAGDAFNGPATAQAEQVGRTIHAQGHAELISASFLKLAPPSLETQAPGARHSSEACYKLFRTLGLEYGPSFRGLQSITVGVDAEQRKQILVEVELPACVRGGAQDFALHPCVMDAILQGSIGLTIEDGHHPSSKALSLPFALEQVEIFGPCPAKAWALIRHSPESVENEKVRRVDIEICNGEGVVCARMKSMTSRVLNEAPEEAAPPLLFAPRWDDLPISDIAPKSRPTAERWIVLLQGGNDEGSNCAVPTSATDSLDVADLHCHQIVLNACGNLEELYEAYVSQLLELLQGIIAARPSNPVLLQVVSLIPQEKSPLLGLAGLIKTAQMESPWITGQLIAIESDRSVNWLRKRLDELAIWGRPGVLRVQEESSHVLHYDEICNDREARPPWRAGGVYLITGGVGGLGLLMAREIVSHAGNCVLILVGRSEISLNAADAMADLRRQGAQVEYQQVDVSDSGVDDLLSRILISHGQLNGVLHCAGVVQDGFLVNLSAGDIESVLAPKVRGLISLDRATQHLPLDLFVLFSSVSGVLGNQGQAVYSAANAFMDGFAAYRNALVRAGERRGPTISIDWPLWADGGMQVDAATRERIERNGAAQLPTLAGMQALYRALASQESQVLVLVGDPQRLRQRVLDLNTRKQEYVPHSPTAVDAIGLAARVEAWLLQRVSEILKVGLPDLDPLAELSEFGFDSISLTHFANSLNKAWNLALMPTVFFEHPTIRRVTSHLIAEHPAVMHTHFEVPSARPIEKPPSTSSAAARVRPEQPRFQGASSALPVAAPLHSAELVAVIGMSGRFPKAHDLDEFWSNLLAGRDCITEVPPSRWDWKAYYGDPHREPNRTNVKFGGFIDGIDQFDPAFFGISPRDAALMDPQQRLMMTYVWKAIEDAGYAASSLSGTKTAVLIGTSGSDYNWLLAQGRQSYSATGIAPSVGPNRISYLLNLHGPSEPIETACSSSLVAIHRGISLISSGQCEMAIVGGVNAVISPRIHISFSKAGMLSDDGRCKTFSDSANGYGRGEGAGILLLKSLSAAERDGDHIYGVLRGSAENHGGRANSLTAPNPVAQAEVIKDAHLVAGIDPRTVGYIEVHGTGTALGDPIEINGLKSAFQQLYRSRNLGAETAHSCGIGSVKTNIGHLELAAGVAGVIKVLLQMKHKTLVKSLHSNPINPYIQLEGSPFYIVRETQAWETLPDAEGRMAPRRAGVSSFGFGGVNSHVVIEEHCPEPSPSYPPQRPGKLISKQQPEMILLSAKSGPALRARAELMLQRIPTFGESDLPDLAYTLQVGRDAMAHRLAFIAHSMSELTERLRQFLNEDKLPELHQGEFRSGNNLFSSILSDDDLRHSIDQWMEHRKYDKLLSLWVNGVDFDWSKCPRERKPKRLALPTYPFATESYWITTLPGEWDELEAGSSTKLQGDHLLNQVLDELLSDEVTLEAAAAQTVRALTVSGSR